MAEFALEEVLSNNLTNTGNSVNLDCAVCLQTCIHPAELPCGHIFCYLCIKGVVNQGRRCAMCRHEIPADYLDKPRLLKPMDAEITSQGFEDGHLWFYEGHNGWWQYDDRTSLELESAYQKGERCTELLIAGFLYIADFDGMIQYRRNDPSKRRRIKRDIATAIKKGIAGLKPTKNTNPEVLNSENETNEINHNSNSVSNSLVANSFGAFRNLTSSSNSPQQQTDSILGQQRIRERNIPGFSLPACRTAPTTNSIRTFEENNSISNYSLGSSIQNTLDWAIEQIESLNLELLNDYETIFRDYSQSEGNLNERRHNRRASNHLSSYLILDNALNESLENEYDEISESNSFSSNASQQSSAALESCPTYSETESRNSSQSVVSSPPPQPPPRNRGMPRLRPRNDSPSRSSTNCEKFFQRFVSKK